MGVGMLSRHQSVPNFWVSMVGFLRVKPHDGRRHKKHEEAFHKGKTNSGTQNEQEDINDDRLTPTNC